jgi:hypothetical protein
MILRYNVVSDVDGDHHGDDSDDDADNNTITTCDDNISIQVTL